MRLSEDETGSHTAMVRSSEDDICSHTSMIGSSEKIWKKESRYYYEDRFFGQKDNR